MLPELCEEIELELRQLGQLMETCAPAMREAQESVPDRMEVLAFAGMLHSFYTGIENLLKRVAMHVDGGPPRGEAWHSAALESKG